MGGPGDFAAAYVIGHEVAHHVQNLVGTSGRVHEAQQRASRADANRLSVMLELQADCYAGVWAHHTNERHQVLEPGDVEEGLDAAAAIGDDRLQHMSGRGVHPESSRTVPRSSAYSGSGLGCKRGMSIGVTHLDN